MELEVNYTKSGETLGSEEEDLPKSPNQGLSFDHFMTMIQNFVFGLIIFTEKGWLCDCMHFEHRFKSEIVFTP